MPDEGVTCRSNHLFFSEYVQPFHTLYCGAHILDPGCGLNVYLPGRVLPHSSYTGMCHPVGRVSGTLIFELFSRTGCNI